MANGTLVVWMLVLVLGGVVLLIVGIVNCYIPSEQKKKIKELEKTGSLSGHEIELKLRIEGLWIIIGAVVIAATSLTFFIIENYGFIQGFFFQSDRLLSVCLLILIIIMVFIVASFILILTPFIVGEIIANQTIRYYEKKYDVIVVDKRTI